jgi:phosphomannomutase
MRGLSCFRAYDIRGRLGIDLDAEVALRVGRAFARAQGAARVVIGRDARASSPELAEALAGALMAEGVEVLDLGLAGTEEMYWATSHFAADGGITVTASHNPIDWNGMKLVARGSAPLGPGDMVRIRALAEAGDFGPARTGGRRRDVAEAARAAYVARLLGFVDPARLPPLHLVFDSGNGAAGPTLDAILAALAEAGAGFRATRLRHDPDSRFPQGIPNPLLPENRPVTARAVQAAGADMGLAFDGDFDRCFFFDTQGSFVDGEHVVALLAQTVLAREPGAAIVHDPRVVWSVQEAVARAGGRAVMARTGHAFMKQAMRDHGAAYGGEMSAHHYFRDFACCDSGMIPWLMIADLMGRTGRSLADLVAERRAAFPSSGEINFSLPDPAAAMARVRAALVPQAHEVDETDGLSLSFGAWRLNLRASNTEPLVRLNVEARGDAALVAEGVARVSALLV